jgi:nucleoside-triphosphatase
LKRLILITGQPSIGKTTILLRTVDALKIKGYKIGGMISREIREGGARVGFEIVDLETRQKGWLAHVNQPDGPKISKYRVNLSDLDAIGAISILNAVADADVIVVDEIGPMELVSPAFKDAVSRAIENEKPVLGTIHYRARDSLITAIKARKDAEILEVTQENREHLHNLIIDRVVELQKKIC